MIDKYLSIASNLLNMMHFLVQQHRAKTKVHLLTLFRVLCCLIRITTINSRFNRVKITLNHYQRVDDLRLRWKQRLEGNFLSICVRQCPTVNDNLLLRLFPAKLTCIWRSCVMSPRPSSSLRPFISCSCG